jgi:hypothetical protein
MMCIHHKQLSKFSLPLQLTDFFVTHPTGQLKLQQNLYELRYLMQENLYLKNSCIMKTKSNHQSTDAIHTKIRIFWSFHHLTCFSHNL